MDRARTIHAGNSLERLINCVSILTKDVLLGFALSLACSACVNTLGRSQHEPQISYRKEDLPQTIDLLSERDQEPRKLPNGRVRFPLSPEEEAHLLAVDLENMQILDSLISLYGYPGISLVGDSLDHIASIIILHNSGNTELVEKQIPYLIEAYKADEIRWTDFQFTIDRYYYMKDGTWLFYTDDSLPHLINQTEDAKAMRALIEQIRTEKQK